MSLLSVVIQIIIIRIFNHLKFIKCSKSFFEEANLYYTAPEFDLNYANVTFASTRFYNETDPESTFLSLGQMIATICQAHLINRNKTEFTINGLINLIFQDYSSLPSSGQAATLTLLSNNLSGGKIYGSRRNYTADVTGFIGIFDYGTAKINSLATNDFGIPLLTIGDLARSTPDNQFSGYFPAEKKTMFQTYNTEYYNTFNAILDLLAHFNWTVVGTIYDSNSFGYTRQGSVAVYSSKNSSPIFACQTIYYSDEADITNSNNADILDSFCNCVSVKDTIQVMVLWMGTTAAVRFVTNLKDRCKASEDWTFIIADDFQTPINFTPLTKSLKNSLLIRGNGPWDVSGFIQECQNGVTPTSEANISVLIEEFTRLGFNCTTKQDDSIETCDSLYYNTEKVCYCSPEMLGADPYLSRYLFSADVVSNYAEGIRLLANNCSYLNDAVDSELKSDIKVTDFCQLTKFTPAILSAALRFVNFTGYSGPIYYGQEYLIRSIKGYYLFSAYTNNGEAVFAGTLNVTTVQIDDSVIQFVNGEVPVSRVVPQNPDLSYAIVVVFFAVSIVYLVICSILLVIFIIYRNSLSMRKASPMVTLAMLIGLMFAAFAQLLQSFSKTDAICTITLYFYQIGFIMVLSGSLVKNWRIYRIFSNHTARAIKITEGSLLLFMAAATSLCIIFITTFVAVFGYDAEVKQSSSNIYYQYVQCIIPDNTWNIIFQIIIRLYIVLFLILSLVLSWLTRKVRSDYRESRTISAFIFVVAASFIILVPLQLTFGDETDSEILRYTVDMEFYAIMILSGLGLLFFPKVYDIYRENKRKNSRLSQ